MTKAQERHAAKMRSKYGVKPGPRRKYRQHKKHDMAGFKGTRRAEYLAERDMLQPLEA